MKGILGTKIAMTQMFDSNGKSMAVTIIKAEPNVVLAVRTKAKDKYDAIQLGFQEKKEKNVTKAALGNFKKANTTPKKTVKEIRDMVGKNVGETVGVETFAVGEIVDVEGITKGHGFTGAIQR
jgi:large subunit ribosomal protein L3